MDPRQELVRYYRLLRHYGLNDSHSGNASVRSGSQVWVTPSGAAADSLTADDLINCATDGEIGDGASLDAPLHLAVYRANPKAGAILHSHGPHAVALTLDGHDFVPADFEGRFYFPRVPVVSVAIEDYVDLAPGMIAEVLAAHPIAIVRGHGVYAWGETLNLAYKWTCSLELSAKTAFIARLAGTLPGADRAA